MAGGSGRMDGSPTATWQLEMAGGSGRMDGSNGTSRSQIPMNTSKVCHTDVQTKNKLNSRHCHVGDEDERNNSLFTVVVRLPGNQQVERRTVTFNANTWQRVSLTLTFVAPPTLSPVLTFPVFMLQRTHSTSLNTTATSARSVINEHQHLLAESSMSNYNYYHISVADEALIIPVWVKLQLILSVSLTAVHSFLHVVSSLQCFTWHNFCCS